MVEILTCSSESRTLNEQLAGTVKPTNIFFLIETNVTDYGGWSNEIVKTIGKSGEFAPYIQHLLNIPRSKVLLIRQPQANEKNFYIALTHHQTPQIYHYMLSSYDDLMKVDLNSISENSIPEIAGQKMSQIDELYAVCTNGKHDPCCSTHGVPLYNALVQHAGADKVWQATHIGGHRMAATMIAFPQGIYYGHLDAFNAEEVVMNHQGGYLLTHKYRGRSAYVNHTLDVDVHRAVGAAEHHIREQVKKYKIDDLTLQQVKSIGDMEWQVTFCDTDNNRYEVTVETTLSEPRQSSCNEAKKPMPVHNIRF